MIDLLRTRRSIRAYADRVIEPEKIELLKEALLRSPSSREIRPWRFYFVQSPATLAALARCKPHGAGFLNNARLGIVVCGEPDRSDVWVEDCSIAALVAHLTAHSLGLGSCWCQIRKRDHDDATTAESYVRSVLGLPGTLTVEAIVAVGYAAQEEPGVPVESLPADRITMV
ncbi:MAG: nitroreductase family protein [Thermodesulfobacteriota bacterium]